jgi:hypothetical protein
MLRKIAIASMLLASTSAFAQDLLGRSLPLDQPLIGIYGKPMRDPVPRNPGESDKDYQLRAEAQEDDGKIVTLGKLATMAFMANLDADRSMQPNDKYENWKLADKINNHPDQLFTVEEVTKIKDRIGHAFGLGVVGPAWRLLDSVQKTADTKPADKK